MLLKSTVEAHRRLQLPEIFLHEKSSRCKISLSVTIILGTKSTLDQKLTVLNWK